MAMMRTTPVSKCNARTKIFYQLFISKVVSVGCILMLK